MIEKTITEGFSIIEVANIYMELMDEKAEELEK